MYKTSRHVCIAISRTLLTAGFSFPCGQVTRAIHHVIGRRFVTLQYELLTAASSELLVKVCCVTVHLAGCEDETRPCGENAVVSTCGAAVSVFFPHIGMLCCTNVLL